MERTLRQGILIGALAAMVALPLQAQVLEQAQVLQTGAPSARLQVIFNPETREVSRRMVRLFGPHPEMTLDFHWQPATGNWPGVTPEGLADGAGVVSWRLPGAASYDPKNWHHRYEGALRAGRFDGAGVLRYRDGSRYEGVWAAGLLQGAGTFRDAEGNVYEGAFVAGRAEGQGILRSREGWIYEGGFVAGLRDGAGRMTEPGGLRYDVVMQRGTEVSSTRPLAFVDETLAGVLPAQSGGGAAGRTRLSAVIDQRITQEQSIQYEQYVDSGTMLIYPQDPELQKIWNGKNDDARLFMFQEFTDTDWDDTGAFVQLDLATEDGSRVRLSSLDLAVEASVPHLLPALHVDTHMGCVGFRPSFDFRNFGWGSVENATARVRFLNPDTYDYEAPEGDRAATRWFDLPVGTFDQGVDVDLRGLLAGAGVDVAALEKARFSCSSASEIEQCGQDAVRSLLRMGALQGFVAASYGTITTELQGELSYTWTDAAGLSRAAVQPFGTPISLAVIEVRGGLAECGAGGAWSAEAPQYTDVELHPAGEQYRVNIPVRGNPNISRLLAGVKLHSARSAMHVMRAEAQFSDGSIRKSPLMKLFFLRPRIPTFVSQTAPESCYLGPEVLGSC
ncbi:MORN repeat-containing protein [Thalassovita taeanensis]|uniref:Uncharacterized conserved protein n=1 Tax=Thalassovita taeanensis TaxID=657014 RepID=A0A1H9L3G9_9RHOB|nr:hypothetical protein [Thalassovita taeanensis]SER06042.1 Uncharacterized conserved protein [Thalassovita taeanensis]